MNDQNGENTWINKFNTSLEDLVLKHEQEFNNKKLDQVDSESIPGSPNASPGKLILSSFLQFVGTVFGTLFR
ncbi:hypothetical protein M2120_000007 [Aurantimicrobium minutum]|nr:hypothetical protein [Aurantimicrobium minutum]